MGGYAAGTTPNTAPKDLAAAGAVAEEERSVLISISLISPVVITITAQ